MADATSRPDVRTPQPRRDDLQRLIPDNIRLQRALEQLFIDVNTTLPDAVQAVGDASQAVTEDVSMGVFGATDRAAARTLTWLADALGKADQDRATIKRLTGRVADLETLINVREPVKPRVEAFIAPTLINSWTNLGAPYNSAGYFKDPFGIVHLRGMITGGAVPSVAFVLPAKYRPLAINVFTVVANNAFGRVDVDSGGNVNVNTGSNAFVSLDGITFRAV